MSGKSLPKPSSKTALNKKYQLLAIETKGRLDTATENGRANINLLQKYYNAFSNLYGAIILDDAWDIFKILEKEKISKKQILKKDFLFFSKPAISFGKNMQRAFEDGTLNKDELIEEIRKLGIDVIDM